MQYKADKAVLHWPAELLGEPNEQEEGGSPFWGETGPAATDLREESLMVWRCTQRSPRFVTEEGYSTSPSGSPPR